MSRLACPQCGSPLPAQSPLGLCPACLLKHGLERGSVTQFPSGQPHSPALDVTLDHTPASAGASPLPERVLPEPGQRYGGYYILRTLGKGGMGAVYEADQLDTGRRVALKVLKHSLDSPEARKRFLREGRLAASVNHPNSVYVFGTEEIDGTPAITMELIAGGTLQQFVKERGPLPIGAAVDTVLQIVAGLEAAKKMGVLHRDIKPANCFIDSDGTVKVGDFGLSISTAARGDTDLTQHGAMLGTPAFSSPEQLRGDELNVRSDLYSVGVTLYYLLTGRTPFEADNLVKLLATVLEQSAPSPRKWRPEIPQPLAAVVLRCLEKQPTSRFRDYEALRQALIPFASTSPSPAMLALRFVASMIDGMVLGGMLIGLQLAVLGNVETPYQVMSRGLWWLMGLLVADTLLGLGYFGLLEGLWGASVGKMVCRLRVVGPDRAAPGLLRAMARAAMLMVLSKSDFWLHSVFEYVGWFDAQTIPWLALGPSLASWGALLAMFATARRSNGYAALHDLITGTRVISREAYQARPTLAQVDDLPPVATVAPQIGPYHVLKTLAQEHGETWKLGYDTRLLRRVWIHELPGGAPPVNASRRNLGRLGRLRWLTGRRSPSENWDAYEAASGEALTTLLDRPHPWSEVRFWLLDLTQELSAAAKDGTMPSQLKLDRVWITADGRAKLLDFRAPGSTPLKYEDGESSASTGDIPMPRRFLSQVACAALEGPSTQVPKQNQAFPRRLFPLSARDFLIAVPALANMDSAIPLLGELTRQPAEASRTRRLSLVLLCCSPILLILLFGALGTFIAMQSLRKYPDFIPLQVHLQVLRDLKRHHDIPPHKPGQAGFKASPENIKALEQYIAYRFSRTIQDPAFRSSPIGRTIIRPLADEVIAAHPLVSEAEFRAAAKILEPLGLSKFELPVGSLLWAISFFAMFFIGGWLIFAAAVSLASAVLFRGGPSLWAVGLAVVRPDGAPASRPRVLWRALLAWSPVVLIAIAMFVPASVLVVPLAKLAGVEVGMGVIFGGTSLIAATIGLFHLLVALWSALLPGRGIPDRLAGTWLVPR